MSVQQLTGGPGPVIEALGKRWRLGFNDQDAKAALEEVIRAHHTRQAIREKRNIGGQEGEDYWSDFSALKARGFYATFSKGWIETMKSHDGILLFLQSLLFKHHEDVSMDQVREIFASEPEQVVAAVEVVAPDFFSAVAVQMGYSTDEAKKAGPQLAAAMREQIEKQKAVLAATTLEPATSST